MDEPTTDAFARRSLVAIAGLIALASPPAGAAESPNQPEISPVIIRQTTSHQVDPAEPKAAEAFEPGLWPALVAVVPGSLFHGAGLWLAGAPEAALTLGRIEAVGLLGTTASLAGIYATGASRDTIGWLTYPGLVAMSAFVAPWAADIYGSAVGGRQARARLGLAPLEARLGYGYIHDPLFEYNHFTYAQAKVRFEPIRLIPTAWVAVNHDNQKLRLEGRGRLFGPRARSQQADVDGTFLDVEAATTWHHFGDEGFETLVFEAQVAGRYDMGRLSSVLKGSFYELSLGIGSQLFGYDVPDGNLGEDVSALLLMETGYGLYFGTSENRYGELKVYYNHRHDGFVAGSGFNTDVDGLFGHVGLDGFYYPSDHWGLFTHLEAAAAYAAVAGLTFRYGGH